MDFADIDAFVAHPRITSLAAAPDGSRVVAAIAEPDADGGRYASALWDLDPTGEREARRITFSARGESSPRFGPDGRLYFASARPDAQEDDRRSAAIWALHGFGEARVVADAPGGLTLVGIGSDGTLLASTRVCAGARLDTDAQTRAARRARRPSAILHTGMPVRYWDDEVGSEVTHLVTARVGEETGAGTGAAALRDLTPRAEPVHLLYEASDLSADGAVAATTWTTRTRRGETTSSVALIDLPRTGSTRSSGTRSSRPARTVLARGTSTATYGAPRISPDGTRVALTRTTVATPTDTTYSFVEIHSVAPGSARTGTGTAAADPVLLDLGDLTATEYHWSPAGDALYVCGDLHSGGAILEVDPVTGTVRRTLLDDGVYAGVSVASTEDGVVLFALRTSIDSPPAPVRIEVPSASQRTAVVTALRAPGGVGRLPGRLERISTTLDGVEVGAWLCTPHVASSADPAPLMVWIHGGPHTSYNAWSWRWCPWLAVARGYAVLLPDPAMSTGYGHEGLNRGWPRRPDVVWAEVEALADLALRRRTLDETRTALLGASFGGFMTNWIAGQTDRFDAIVTHAGLYSLEQQHVTTDMAAAKTRVHRTAEQEPDWYAAYSPDRRVAQISTPMLITHGDRDYRVPVSEALRLWWDLVSHHDGPAGAFPHRFLQFTEQNHWVLTPEDARIWNQVVLDFCDHHVRGVGTALAQVPFTP